MALNQPMLRKLRQRDPYCLHCGEDRIEYLVPHHRQNRGMGGRAKTLDVYENLLLICGVYNQQMEADRETQQLAEDYGHKISQYGELTDPVFDSTNKRWYKLLPDGTKREGSEATRLF